MSQDLKFELGQLSFWTLSDPLCLSSRFSLSISNSGPNDFLHSTGLDLKSFAKGAVWMRRGAGLRFNISIDAEGFDLDSLAKEVFMEDVGATLKKAEIWSQLLLDVSLSIFMNDDYNASHLGTITLALVHHNSPLETKVTFLRSRKLLLANIEPPHGILSGSLREVNIQATFSVAACTSPGSRKRQRKSHIGRALEVASETEMCVELLDDVPEDDEQVLSQGSFDPFRATERSLSSRSLAGLHSASSMLESVNGVWNTGSEENAGVAATLPTLQLSRGEFETRKSAKDTISKEATHSPTSATGLGRQHKRRNTDQEQRRPTSLDVSASVELLDATFRRLLSGNKPRLGIGVRQSQPLQTPALSEISPVLFAPGYLAAVAQRSQLMGRMAKSIASGCYRSESVALRASAFNFLDSRTSGLGDANQTDLGDHDKLPEFLNRTVLSSELHKTLWTLTQLSAFDRAAAKRLKPLKMPPGPNHMRQILQWGMLDRTPSPPNLPAESSHSSSSLRSQADVNLFSDEEECDDERMLEEMEFLESTAEEGEFFENLFEDCDEPEEAGNWDLLFDDETEAMLDADEVPERDEMLFSDDE